MSTLLADSFAFIAALANMWVGLLGGFVFTVYLLYERRRGELEWKRFRWIVVGYLVVAGFLAWREQYRTATALQTEKTIADKREADLQTKPDLRLFIEAIGLQRGNDRVAGPVTVIAVLLVVTNVGAESVAKQWAAYAQRPGEPRTILTASF